MGVHFELITNYIDLEAKLIQQSILSSGCLSNQKCLLGSNRQAVG